MSAALTALNATHAPATQSWVESANAVDTDFPIQNLPFGRFRHNALEPWQIGVAIGDRVLDLHATGLIDHNNMARLMAAPVEERRALRLAIWEGLRAGSALQKVWSDALLRQTEVELGLPCEVGDYTDFYTGIHHATTVGKLFRPDNPLLPNYKWVPIGYHGRASSIGASGQQFHRPRGQTLKPGASVPDFGPTARLDYELEMAAWVGMDNALGAPVSIADAEDHLFGLTLLNDWSARDVQAWEYQPLGPFLAKNFATTVSPWLVTMEALAPFRAAFVRSADDPQPMAYLDSAHNRSAGALDVQLEVWLQTPAMRAAGSAGERLSQSNLRDAYWTLAQLVAHHTVNGCNLRPGDVLGTGTLSGPAPEQGGSLLELTQGGKQPITLPNGEVRTFLQDGDTIILRGACEAAGARRIGFGECRGTLLAAR
ncbi:MAG TPA: fumarylacetoacetase [Rhodoferax sp.]|uniref:fumarylacetoacetase n=1 Tax=Rhodoferax sp. TaxID=50421 RepID=UPI0008B69A96|nr:fumarylacetoacetase [Rhodoferax sp.]OGO97755.1 MAG: fumarylacetoacetase [Curvibacter sp. GWA2_63_95]HCX83221.1 fumarylacetoacetase [Rhodoferax sp.]